MSDTPEAPKPDSARPVPQLEAVPLETPIRRGDQSIDTVHLRKPKAGELRGLQLQSVLQGDVNAMLTLIPRISQPPLLAQEVENLEVEDMAALAATVMGFFMSRADREAMAKVLGQAGTSTS